MKKSLATPQNTLCPQTLFVLGTYKDDGNPNFGLICWFSYCWDGELNVMFSLGGGKLTKDNIHKRGVLSASLVPQHMLSLADYFGNVEGYDAHKMDVAVNWEPGAVLPVPVWSDSPWTFELEVKRTIELDDSEVYICGIRNVLVDESYVDDEKGEATRVPDAHSVLCADARYFSMGEHLAAWGEPRAKMM